jgi:hypothetical protein
MPHRAPELTIGSATEADLRLFCDNRLDGAILDIAQLIRADLSAFIASARLF